MNRNFASRTHKAYRATIREFVPKALRAAGGSMPQRALLDAAYASGVFSTNCGRDEFRKRMLEHLNDMVRGKELRRTRAANAVATIHLS